MPVVKTARELRNRVRVKFGKRSDALSFPEHIVLYEVPFLGRPKFARTREELGGLANDPRFLSRQRYDVVAVGIWPSSKNLVHGFELKVSRSDLLHELRDLSKSEYAASNVDRFWLVLGDKDIMKDTDPIPESWGILVAHGRGLRIVRQPAEQEGRLDRSLVRGLTTRALVDPTIGREVRYLDGLRVANRYREDFYRQQTASRAEQAERDAFNQRETWKKAEDLAYTFGHTDLGREFQRRADV